MVRSRCRLSLECGVDCREQIHQSLLIQEENYPLLFRNKALSTVTGETFELDDKEVRIDISVGIRATNESTAQEGVPHMIARQLCYDPVFSKHSFLI